MSKRRHITTFTRRAKKRGYDDARCRRMESAVFKQLHLPLKEKRLLAQSDELQHEREIRNPRYNGAAWRCSRCREYKIDKDFSPDNRRHNLPRGYCKVCERELDRERRFAKHAHAMGKKRIPVATP